MLDSFLFAPFGSTCPFIIIMNPYLIHMVPGTSVAAHISQLHATMRDHMQNPSLSFIMCWNVLGHYCGRSQLLLPGLSIGNDIVTL